MKKTKRHQEQIGLKVRYIKTMDFEFENVIILNCKHEYEVADKIRRNAVIAINNEGTVEYINSSYIMFYQL